MCTSLKKKAHKIERMSAPVSEKSSIEEPMEVSASQRFSHSLEIIFDNSEYVDLNSLSEEDDFITLDALIGNYQLMDLCSEAAKLKMSDAMASIPPEHLVKLLKILEKNITYGVNLSPISDPDYDDEESRLKLILEEKVMRAVDASLISLYIMTSANMPKIIYLEDVIDSIVSFTKNQLKNTIYPSFDPVYRLDYKFKGNLSTHRKKVLPKEVIKKSTLTLYTKLLEVVALLAELLNIQVLTDEAVLHASSLGVSPFFVEGVNDLQLSSLKLVTMIFSKYEKHRGLILDDILGSIFRVENSKRSVNNYHLSSDTNIQMLSAMVFHIIQCVVSFPEGIPANEKVDTLIVNKYETAMRIGAKFLSALLTKCGTKNEGMDNRPIFENFVADLLITLNKPEWPVAEMLLIVLGTLLVKYFTNKNAEMPLRSASLDYFGVIVARLRKDAVSLESKLDSIDKIAKEIREGQKVVEESGVPNKKKMKKDKVSEDLELEEDNTQLLQQALLDYLAVNGLSDVALCIARHFFIAQWYYDATVFMPKAENTLSSKKLLPKKSKKSKKKQQDKRSEEEIPINSDLDEKDSSMSSWTDEERKSEIDNSIDKRKRFLISKILSFEDVISQNKSQRSSTYIGYENAELISCYFSYKRPFYQSFDAYLKQILCLLTESCISIRTKAMKCLTMIVEADPNVLGHTDMQLGVQHSFLDYSSTVREAAIDLVGKYILRKTELIDKYYDMLSARILDSSISVRKRVIKILNQICVQCPDYPKISEICVKMIRRMNDEEGVRKLVIEVFQNMWFVPVQEIPQLDSTALIRKVMNITDFVAKCQDVELDKFGQLLLSLFKPKEDKDKSSKKHAEPPKFLLTACHQIVDCLIENVLKLEETGFMGDAGQASRPIEEVGGDKNQGSSQHLVACLMTLYLFAKIRPRLLLAHAITLLPYLSIKCQNQGDSQIISNVAKTLGLVVPLMEHPSDMFLAQLEEDSIKVILLYNKNVVGSCLSCLSAVINNVTRNFKLVRDCFRRYYGHLSEFKLVHEKEPSDPRLLQCRPFFRRALFTVGLILRHFDFTHEEVRHDLPEDIKDQAFETLIYFAHQPDQDMQSFATQAIGSLCARHYEFMLGTELKTIYTRALKNESSSLQMKIQVLNNIEMYLQEEERRMIKQDEEWEKLSKQESLKEMNDVSSGMASTVIQLYLKEILESFIDPSVVVRHAVLKVVQLVLQQGLVHPAQILPCLICMSTDVDVIIGHSAEKQLQDIERKYPGFVHMKSLDGINLSYKLQKTVHEDGIVRGYRIQEGEGPSALIADLYSILRHKKQQRRAIALSILKHFDEQVNTSLSQLLYLTDNLAYLPFLSLDEPLFLIHHIDIMISVTGTNILQDFQEAFLQPYEAQEEQPDFPLVMQEERNAAENSIEGACDAAENSIEGACDSNASTSFVSTTSHSYCEEEVEDASVLLARLTEDSSILQECITASQGCMLLILLREHLKKLYGISETKIAQYSPSVSDKPYAKTVNRRHTPNFEPKAILQILNKGSPAEASDETSRRSMVQQYLEFKQLILWFDSNDADDKGEARDRSSTSKPSRTSARAPDHHSVSMEEDSDRSLGEVGTPKTASSNRKVSKYNTRASSHIREV